MCKKIILEDDMFITTPQEAGHARHANRDGGNKSGRPAHIKGKRKLRRHGKPAYSGKKQLQWKLPLRGDASKRKNKFAPKVYEESRNGFRWSTDAVVRCHVGLLNESLEQLTYAKPGSAVHQDVVEWLAREGSHPFSFETCFLFACQDPSWPFAHLDLDDLRARLLKKYAKAA